MLFEAHSVLIKYSIKFAKFPISPWKIKDVSFPEKSKYIISLNVIMPYYRSNAWIYW